MLCRKRSRKGFAAVKSDIVRYSKFYIMHSNTILVTKYNTEHMYNVLIVQTVLLMPHYAEAYNYGNASQYNLRV